MKKSSILVILCLGLGISSSFAQASFGIKAGVNMANMDFDTGTPISIETNTSLGFYVGPYANLDLAAGFALHPELLLSMQGFKLNNNEDGDDVKFESMYLNLPIMGRYAASEQLYVEFGPQVGFLMSAKTKLGDESEDVKDDFKSLDFGLNIGAGYQLPMGLAIEARYNFGLADVSDDGEGEGSLKNRVFSFGLSYSF